MVDGKELTWTSITCRLTDRQVNSWDWLNRRCNKLKSLQGFRSLQFEIIKNLLTTRVKFHLMKLRPKNVGHSFLLAFAVRSIRWTSLIRLQSPLHFTPSFRFHFHTPTPTTHRPTLQSRYLLIAIDWQKSGSRGRASFRINFFLSPRQLIGWKEMVHNQKINIESDEQLSANNGQMGTGCVCLFA